MADNLNVTPGTGATIAADDVSGALHQRMKISIGADGSALDLSSANPMPISDNGGSITVDGTLAVTNADIATLAGAVAGTEIQVDVVSSALPTDAATETKQDTIIGHVDGIEALLTTMDEDTSALAAAVDGTELQVDIVTSALPTGAATSLGQDSIITAIGDLETLLTTIDADTSTLAGSISGTEAQVDVVSLPASANQDGGPAWTTVRGVSGAAVISADATTPAAVTDAPTAGQKIVVTDIVFSVGADMTVQFEEETSETILFNMYCLAGQSYQISPRSKCKLDTADKKLMVDASVAGAISVTAFYYSEA